MDAPTIRLDRYSHPGPHIVTIAPRVALEITKGRVQQRLRHVRGRVFLIGTANDCDLVLGDLRFPEAYAYLFAHDAEVTIRRLGSGPELLVCGEAVETAELRDGDLLGFGPFELRVLSVGGPPVPRGTPARDGQTDYGAWEHDQSAPDATDEVRLLLAEIHAALAEGTAPRQTPVPWMPYRREDSSLRRASA
jgi:hypothetical protein